MRSPALPHQVRYWLAGVGICFLTGCACMDGIGKLFAYIISDPHHTTIRHVVNISRPRHDSARKGGSLDEFKNVLAHANAELYQVVYYKDGKRQDARPSGTLNCVSQNDLSNLDAEAKTSGATDVAVQVAASKTWWSSGGVACNAPSNVSPEEILQLNSKVQSILKDYDPAPSAGYQR